MSEEEINKIVKEHYGFTVEEIDNMVGNLSLKIYQLEKEVERLKNEKAKRAEDMSLELTKAWCGQAGVANHTKVMEVYRSYVEELTKHV